MSNLFMNSLPPLPHYLPETLSVIQAQQIIHGTVLPVEDIELVPILDALDRILATDVISPIDVPAHDNAAMDGYAFHGSQLGTDPLTLRVAGIAYAGQAFQGTVSTDECVRIMTGAVMPPECDTVIPQEAIQQLDSTSVTLPPNAVKAGDHCRQKGEDLAVETVALCKGKILRPAEIGLLASLGIAQIPVWRRLRVALFSTGDELRAPGETFKAGCLYDSNRYTLYGMLKRLGCDVIDMGIIPDNPLALETALRSACKQADAILTSGGISVGDADYTKQIMARLGNIAFWKIAMRPGRPMAFGTIASNGKQACFFGLPGNPVAAMVAFYCIVRNALQRMMGADTQPLPLIPVRAQTTISKKVGRTEYQRGIVSPDINSNLQVRITGTQGSGILRSMSEANCLIVLEQERDHVNAGEMVDVMLFEGLV